MDEKTIHLGFIEKTIGRMAKCSFTFKKMSVLLLCGLLIKSIWSPMFYSSLISLIPLFFFWCLDSFYLLQERKYRGLYEMVRNDSVSNYTMNPNEEIGDTEEDTETKKKTFISSLFSKTEFFFYVPMGITFALLMFA